MIGNRRQKQQYIQLGAVQLLVAALQSNDAAQLVQAAAALGSFAASEQGLQVLLQHGGIPHLLRVLVGSSDDKVVEAAVRALKAVARVRGSTCLAGMGRHSLSWLAGGLLLLSSGAGMVDLPSVQHLASKLLNALVPCDSPVLSNQPPPPRPFSFHPSRRRPPRGRS